MTDDYIFDDDMETELTEEEEGLVAAKNRAQLERNIDNLWNYSTKGLEAKKAAMTMLSTKTGMYARIPIICKGAACPYAHSCQLLENSLAPEGEYCPIETTQIEYRFKGYAEDFGIEDASFTDKALITEIINCDILMERCTALMADEGTPVSDIVIGINNRGEEIMQPEVSKAWEMYERASKKRSNAYNLMMATRKDKKDEKSDGRSLSQILEEAVGVGDFIVEDKPEHIIIEQKKEEKE